MVLARDFDDGGEGRLVGFDLVTYLVCDLREKKISWMYARVAAVPLHGV